MPGAEGFEHLERHRARVEQTRENGARLAKSYAQYVTTGWGEILVPDVFDFGVTFTEEPSFTTGCVVLDDLIEGRFPRVTAGVKDWQQDENGYYTGAYVFFVVETMSYQLSEGVFSYDADPNYEIRHHLVFEAMAYKAVDVTLLTD